MGLDMYLYERTFCRPKKPKKKEDGIVYPSATVQTYTDWNGREHQRNKIEHVCYVWSEIGYWRKANAIHKWFVDNHANGEDDCKDIYVTLEDLMELKKLCQEVLDNPFKAKELLPTQEGFFFGSTEYDEYYMHDIQHTIDILNNLKPESYEIDYIYHASW